MDPYVSDQDELVAAIERVVASPRLATFSFVGSPLRGVLSRLSHAEQKWVAPPRATTVVLISDLGLGGPVVNLERSRRSEWTQFASKCRRAGSSVVAFVPFAPSRWDPVVAHLIRHVHWDRRTTAGVVHRAMSVGQRTTHA